tara:strand:+ start:1804 stop:2916 length:1113 start_codon:yes stop_codon:yes gene_type:complete
MKGVQTRLVGVSHSDDHNCVLEQSMHKKDLSIGKGLLPGSIVYTEPFKDFVSEGLLFSNETLGTAMNQNVAFGGTPELIFNGGSGGTEWTGSGDGAWDFADGGKVTVNHGANNSVALFQDSGTVLTSGYSALTGKVDLDNYSPATQKLVIQFGIDGLALGNSVFLDDYIDTSNFTEQDFVVPLADFGLTGVAVDEFTITINRTAGHNPHVSFDDFQIEETGTPLRFTAKPLSNERFHASELRIVVAAPLTGITSVSGATENATVPNLSYDDFMGINLSVGFTIQRTTDNVTGFAGTIRDISDLLFSGASIKEMISDGTNMFVVFSAPFSHGIVIDGTKKDNAVITINDNMSGLLKFSAILIGGRELRQLK